MSPHGKAVKLFNAAKERSLKEGWEIDIDVEWIETRINKGICEITDIPFEIGSGRSFTPSLDRWDNSKGYTKENTKVVCWILNRAKGINNFEDVVKIARSIVKKFPLKERMNEGSEEN